MFDDLKQNPASENNPPDNLPNESVGEPAMDDAQTPTKPVDDMFGDVDPTADKGSALGAGKIQAVSQTQDPQMLATPQDLAIEQMAVDQDNSIKIKKIAAMVISILLLAAIATWVYVEFFSNNENPEGQVVVEEEEEEPVVEEEEEEPVVEEDIPEDEELVDEGDRDYDGDSLTNSREELLGTDPLEPDTDNDGVFDWDEVEFYNTDPLEPDTDGDELSDYDELYVWGTDPNDVDTDLDGFGDGVEVANGYNPFGDGDLSDFVSPEKRNLE